MKKQTILLLGSGGREHAFAEKISTSKACKKLFIAPGNSGTALCGENVEIDPLDFDKLRSFVEEKAIDMIVVGPEQPLASGIVDFFQQKNIPVIGPSKAGAKLESSKAFSKQFMQRNNIPTALSRTFTSQRYAEAKAYIRNHALPLVLKASGLAAGKGVVICSTHAEAEQTLSEMMLEAKFGNAGETVVIEDFLKGIELSVFIATDGKDFLLFPTAKDYKRIGEGDTGPNTGGMGAVSPALFANQDFLEKIKQKVIFPTLQGLQKEKIPYKGFLFIGLMKVGEEPFVIEYNVRMGDPETQVVLPRIKNDFIEILQAINDGDIASLELSVDPNIAATIILASEGYPEKYQKGLEIVLGALPKNVRYYHAGIRAEGNKLFTNGGRVLAITGIASSLEKAISSAYEQVNKVSFEGKYYRKDIGQDLLKENA